MTRMRSMLGTRKAITTSEMQSGIDEGALPTTQKFRGHRAVYGNRCSSQYLETFFWAFFETFS